MTVTEDIKTMKLYTDMDRIESELADAGYDRKVGTVPAEVVHKITMLSYSGVQGCDRVIDVMQLGEGKSVVDVGSGLGGPARVISEKSNCVVKCLEIQKDIHELAESLTSRCDMANKVQCVMGNAADEQVLDVLGKGNDGVVSWLAVLHIPMEVRPSVFKNMATMLHADGWLFIEDFFARSTFTEEEAVMLDVDVSVPQGVLPSRQQYVASLESAGFKNIQWTDLTSEWTDFVSSRHASYVQAKDRHTRVHNENIFGNMNHFYTVVSKLFAGGSLGGVRIIAQKA